MNRLNKRLLKIVQIIFVVAIIVFALSFIYSNWQQLSSYNLTPNTLYLATSFVVYVLGNIVMSVRWKHLIALNGDKISLKSSYKVISLSLVARYLPGGFWDQFGKYTLTRNYKISRRSVLLSLWLDSVMTIFSGVLVFLISLLFIESKNPSFLLISAVVAILSFIALYPPFLQKMLNTVLKFLKKERVVLSFNYFTVLKTLPLYLFYWLLLGLSFFTLLYSFEAVSLKLIPAIIGLYSISWIVGFLTLIAPNGLGIREATLSLLLTPIIPLPVIIVSTIGFRLLTIFSDLILAVIAGKLSIKKPRTGKLDLA